MAALGQAKQYSSGGQQGGGQQAPSRPRVYPYSDRMTTSAQHYDLFEMIRNPHPGPATRLPDPPPPGVLYEASLSKQFKIRRELEQRFYSSSQVLAGTAKVVRFAFMVLVLPFYLIIYRLPHWILTGLLPAVVKKITEYVQRVVHRVCKRISLVVTRSVTRFVAAIKAPFFRIWEAMVKEVELGDVAEEKNDHLDFFAFIAHGFVLLYFLIVNPLKNGAVTCGRLTVDGYFYVVGIPSRCKAWVKEKRDFLRDLNKQLLRGIQVKIDGWLDAVYDATIGRFKRTMALVRQLREKAKARVVAMIPTFEFPSFYRAISYVKDSIKEVRFPAIRFPQLTQFNVEALFKPIADRFENIKNRFSELLERARKLYSKMKFNISLPSFPHIRLPEFQLRAYVQHVMGPVKKHLLEAVRITLYTLIKPVVSVAVPTIGLFRKSAFKLPTISAKAGIHFPKIARFNRYILPLKQFKNDVLFRVETVSMHVRFFIAWTHILLRYGMAQVKQFGDSLL